MASPSSPIEPNPENPSRDLLKEIRIHEVAISELNSLAPSRVVYQKNGGLFFRKSVKAAIAFEEKQLGAARAQLQKLDTA